MHLEQGVLLQGGKYKILRHISSGGFGNTYEGVHTMMDTRVAIKEFFPKMFCNRDENTSHITVASQSNRDLVEKLREKFTEEAKAIFRMNHPNIVKVHDIFEENGTAYYVMDYIEGESLSEIVKQRVALSEAEALGYIRQVTEALKYVHSLNRLHLDIKPGNIMIDKNGIAILIDFGASKHYDMESGENTSTLMGVNTKGYAPVEQSTQSFTKFSPATDIYALGATLYKLLTGITPPDAQMLLAKEETLSPLPASLSASTRNAVLKAMTLIRADRPQTIDAFLALLDSNTVDISDDESTVCEEGEKLNEQRINRIIEGKKQKETERKRKEDYLKKTLDEGNLKAGKKKWMPIGGYAGILALAVIAVIIVFINGKDPVHQPNGVAERIEYNSIDTDRVEGLISSICKNSSKGGDFNALKDYFTDEIYPHPSGEKRYNHNIGEKLEAYVNRFPQYKISSPYNYSYENTSFPLTVNCDVIVDWIDTKGVSKQAIVHKTYYITAEYKVSGMIEKQEKVGNNNNLKTVDLSKVISAFLQDGFYYNSFGQDREYTLQSNGLEMTETGYKTQYSAVLIVDGKVLSDDGFGRVQESIITLSGPRAYVELMEIYTESYVLGDSADVESYLRKTFPSIMMLFEDHQNLTTGNKTMYETADGLKIGYFEDSGTASGSIIIYVSKDISVVKEALNIE